MVSKYNNTICWQHKVSGTRTLKRPIPRLTSEYHRFDSILEADVFNVLSATCTDLGLNCKTQVPILVHKSALYGFSIKYIADFLVTKPKDTQDVISCLKDGIDPSFAVGARFCLIEAKGAVTPECKLKTKLLFDTLCADLTNFRSVGMPILDWIPNIPFNPRYGLERSSLEIREFLQKRMV